MESLTIPKPITGNLRETSNDRRWKFLVVASINIHGNLNTYNKHTINVTSEVWGAFMTSKSDLFCDFSTEIRYRFMMDSVLQGLYLSMKQQFS